MEAARSESVSACFNLAITALALARPRGGTRSGGVPARDLPVVGGTAEKPHFFAPYAAASQGDFARHSFISWRELMVMKMSKYFAGRRSSWSGVRKQTFELSNSSATSEKSSKGLNLKNRSSGKTTLRYLCET